MPRDAALEPEDCNCFAMRSAARHVTQLYDHLLAPTGLRTTQFSILAMLKRLGPQRLRAFCAITIAWVSHHYWNLTIRSAS